MGGGINGNTCLDFTAGYFGCAYSDRINGYEFSLKKKAGNKSKKSWLDSYGDATWVNIHKDNYKDFIL